MQSLFSLLCVRWPQHKTRCSRGLRPRVTMSFVRGYSPDLFVLASYFASQGSQLTQCLFGLFGVRGFPCHSGSPSINETPLPGMVWAIITVGLSYTALA